MSRISPYVPLIVTRESIMWTLNMSKTLFTDRFLFFLFSCDLDIAVTTHILPYWTYWELIVWDVM